MISKELAKAVLSGKYKKTYYSDDEVIACNINIYELANKCKDWASHKDIGLASWVEQYPDGACELSNKHKNIKILFSANTEPEAIFKACEWILANES